jgi:hypothetical protein
MRTKGYNGGVKRLTAAIMLCALPATLTSAQNQGTLTVFGMVQLDNVTVRSGTALRAGQTVSTNRDGRALLNLNQGANISLSPSATALVENSCVTLLAGSASMSGGPGVVLMAGQLRLEANSEGALITAKMLEKGRVAVEVSNGGAVVTDPTGVVLAKLFPGQALLFGLNGREQRIHRNGGTAPGIPEAKMLTPKAGGKAAKYVLLGAGPAGGIAFAERASWQRGS